MHLCVSESQSHFFKKIMINICDSHVEFVHHKKDIKDPKVLDFIGGQISPEQINQMGSGLFFLAVFVEQSQDAYQKAVEVISAYHKIIIKNKWNLVLDKGDIKSGKINVLLHLEDLFCIGNDLEKIDELYLSGIRSIGLTHNKANQFSSGALEGKSGLTDLGRRAVKRIISRGIVLDAAHISEKGFFDIAKMGIKPFISHCGLKSLVDKPRNVSDKILQEIKCKGGYVGIGCAGSFLSRDTAEIKDYIKQIEYAQKIAGDNRVGIGSDFGGIISSLPIGLNKLVDFQKKDLTALGNSIRAANLLNFMKSIGF